MPWVRLVIAFAVCCLGSTSLGVSMGAAATITRLYTFSASGFEAGAPTDPVTGSVTVTFDPLVSNANLPVDAIVLTIGTHTYTPAEVGAEYTAGLDELLVGGLLNGISAVSAGTDDFFVALTQASTLTPGFGFFVYSTAGGGIFFHVHRVRHRHGCHAQPRMPRRRG